MKKSEKQKLLEAIQMASEEYRRVQAANERALAELELAKRNAYGRTVH